MLVIQKLPTHVLSSDLDNEVGKSCQNNVEQVEVEVQGAQQKPKAVKQGNAHPYN